MGEVYRAHDTRLDRDVALKVLPADMAADPARLERFEREAKTVAGLNHPHIVHLYSVEEDGGVHFLTMELVEGPGLDSMVAGNGLPLPKVFDIGIAVADALAAAHDKGIVHRDLKPANVMLAADGRVKVLDFGLAKLSDAPAASAHTATRALPITTEGTVMGTVPYMSPEQLRGLVVDHRSDIFSLGVMLYELALGRRPFSGATNADITSSILTSTPPAVTQVRPELPHHLGRIVAHCLEKDPDLRVQSARDIRNELRALRKEVESGHSEIHTAATPAVAPPRSGSTSVVRRPKMFWIGAGTAALAVVAASVFFMLRGRETALNPSSTAPAAVVANTTDDHSIAVLPFVNMSSDKEQDYLSDGISEQLLDLLSRIPELKVAARTSSFSFKGKGLEIPEMARQLGVAHVLEGSVRKSGNQVRITAQLIHATDGFHMWSQTYDRTLDDVFKIQDEIAGDVVRELKVTLLGAAPKARETRPEAYTLYLRAVQLGRLASPKSYGQSDDPVAAGDRDRSWLRACLERAGKKRDQRGEFRTDFQCGRTGARPRGGPEGASNRSELRTGVRSVGLHRIYEWRFPGSGGAIRTCARARSRRSEPAWKHRQLPVGAQPPGRSPFTAGDGCTSGSGEYDGAL
jgi:TolB-like protein